MDDGNHLDVKGGVVKDPFHIQWHITNLCDLRCKHCYQDNFSKGNDLNQSDLKKISDHLLTTISEWDQTACIHLTGGEPLLKPELFPLLKELDQKSSVEELAVITNGLLLNQEVVNRFSSISKLKKIKVSLDGSTPEINDSIRSSGTFKNVIKNITSIKKENPFEFIMMFTVMRRNYNDLSNFIRLCEDLNVDGVIIERFIPLGRGKEIKNEVLSREEWGEMIGRLLDLFKADLENLSLPTYQAFQIHFNGEDPVLLGAPCVIGVDGICIMPEGTVFPCRRFPISIGSLLETPLKQIWEESEILETLRKKENLKGKCRSCEMKDCRGCRSLALALTGNYLEEDPYCRYPDLSY
ncbi:MAG: radical SAM protein [Syntrophaceae bacterium]|nr:radical SAM protein [Syntrophaceae bacterium]